MSSSVPTPAPLPPEAAVQPVGGLLPRLRTWYGRGRQRLTLREETLFLLLAVIIGLFSGLAVVCFRILIEWTRITLLGSGLYPTGLRVLLVPAAAGLVIAFLVIRFFPQVRGSGVNQTKICGLRIRRIHPVQYRYRKIHRLRPGDWQWPIARSRGSFAANRRGHRFISWPALAPLPR